MIIKNEFQIYNYLTKSGPNAATIKGRFSEETNVTKNLDLASLGKNDFMKLLLAELKYQDPLNPAGNTEFIGQLAQFSSLEQMTRMNLNLEKTLENNTLMAEAINNAMMINYLGKQVTASTELFNFNGSDPVQLKFDLGSELNTGQVLILDATGTTIQSIPIDELGSGVNIVEWDGIKNTGVIAPAGVYYFEVEAKDNQDNRIEVKPIFTGVIDGISYKDGFAYFKIGEVLVPFNKVHQIVTYK